jgi:Xaa-Pro aminopeptidase
MNNRVDQLRAQMVEKKLDALLVTDTLNRAYLSGFSGSSGVLLVTPGEAYVVTDFRYFEQAEGQAPGWHLWKQTRSLAEAVGDLLKEVNPTKLGFEADGLTVSEWNSYKKHGPEGTEWVETEGLIRRLRARKSTDEIEAIRRAQRITDEAAQHLPRLIQPGKTEKQVAWELEKVMRDLGADGPAFEIIVASGPNSAMPHYHPGERVISENEIVLVDFGAKLGGYHSDMTRTYFTGEPPAEYAHIYNIVLDALHLAEQGIRAGVGAKEADAIARDFISEHDHPDDFGHSLGHGIGLDIHELPPLSFRAQDDEKLEVAQVVTIEPGIYLPGWGGVRIEDLALVTEEGIEIFTTTTKDIDAWRKAQA